MWIETRSGRRVHLSSPDPTAILISDICYSLAQLPRFTGHGRSGYSVLDHSLNVGYALPEESRIHGFLHDAAEAYIGDISSPLKQWLDRMTGGRLGAIERDLLAAIYKSLGVPLPTEAQKKLVKEADVRLLNVEAAVFEFLWAPAASEIDREMIVADGMGVLGGKAIINHEIMRIKNA